MKKNVLIIGAGGVANVVAHKCAQYNDIFGKIIIASKTLSKCDDIIKSIERKNNYKNINNPIDAYKLDAFDIEETIELINKNNINIVINVASSFLNMYVLEACIKTNSAYIDTAIHEDPGKVCENPPWYANYEWKKSKECENNNVTAILGIGFDPGVVNAYVKFAVDNIFDEIESVDIIDINHGNHGHYFATNFDPEINFREFTGRVWTWQENAWKKNQMFEIKRKDNLPIVGKQTSYLTGHDEIHSLSQKLGIPNIRFWMGFSEHYINVFNVLKNIGLLSEKKIKLDSGLEIVPLKVIKAILPDPSSLAPNYQGKTFIGTLIKGNKASKEKEVLLYNVKDHQESYKEVESQAISYTAGVPAVAAALLINNGTWDVKKMVNVEELPSEPFIKLLNNMGLTTHIKYENKIEPLSFND